MTVLVRRRDGVFVHGVLPATFTHRTILSVPAQLQLTHCQRRTAFSSNRFACHTFWVKKAIGFSPINTFPPDQLDTCYGEPKENISTWKTQIKSRNKGKKILKSVRRLEVNFSLRNLLFSYAARSFEWGNEKWKSRKQKVFPRDEKLKNFRKIFQSAVLQSLKSSIAHRFARVWVWIS